MVLHIKLITVGYNYITIYILFVIVSQSIKHQPKAPPNTIRPLGTEVVSSGPGENSHWWQSNSVKKTWEWILWRNVWINSMSKFISELWEQMCQWILWANVSMNSMNKCVNEFCEQMCQWIPWSNVSMNSMNKCINVFHEQMCQCILWIIWWMNFRNKYVNV